MHRSTLEIDRHARTCSLLEDWKLLAHIVGVQIFRAFWWPKLDSHKGCRTWLVSDGLGSVETAAWWFVDKLDRLLAMWLA